MLLLPSFQCNIYLIKTRVRYVITLNYHISSHIRFHPPMASALRDSQIVQATRSGICIRFLWEGSKSSGARVYHVGPESSCFAMNSYSLTFPRLNIDRSRLPHSFSRYKYLAPAKHQGSQTWYDFSCSPDLAVSLWITHVLLGTPTFRGRKAEAALVAFIVYHSLALLTSFVAYPELFVRLGLRVMPWISGGYILITAAVFVWDSSSNKASTGYEMSPTNGTLGAQGQMFS